MGTGTHLIPGKSNILAGFVKNPELFRVNPTVKSSYNYYNNTRELNNYYSSVKHNT